MKKDPNDIDDDEFERIFNDADQNGQVAFEAEADAGAELPEQPAAAAVDEPLVDATAAGGTPAGETAAEADAPTDAATDAAADAAAEAPAAEPAEALAEAPPQGDSEPAAEPFDVEKERQRLRSWEGRLKKIEAELAAKADAAAAGKPESNGPATDGTNTESQAADALERVASEAEADGETTLADDAGKAAEMVQSGDLSVADAMRQLAEDFGEDFVRMIEVIASAKAKEAGLATVQDGIGKVRKDVDDIIAHIDDSRAQAHFKEIAAKHPDFREVGQSEGFAQYVGGLDEAKQADARRVVESGSAEEIVTLLDAYKAAREAAPADEQADDNAPAADPVVDAQMDAAEGVRSAAAGMRLPDQPQPSAMSYEDAWSEFS